jgi:hypothetical protein
MNFLQTDPPSPYRGGGFFARPDSGKSHLAAVIDMAVCNSFKAKSRMENQFIQN